VKLKEFLNTIEATPKFDNCLIFGRGITSVLVESILTGRNDVYVVDLKNVYVNDLEEVIDTQISGNRLGQTELIIFVTQNVQALDYVDIEQIFFAKEGDIHNFNEISEVLERIDCMNPSEIVLNCDFFK